MNNAAQDNKCREDKEGIEPYAIVEPEATAIAAAAANSVQAPQKIYNVTKSMERKGRALWKKLIGTLTDL